MCLAIDRSLETMWSLGISAERFNAWLQLAIVVILFLTLRETFRVAQANRKQADTAEGHATLSRTIELRPMLSVDRLEMEWKDRDLLSIAFVISNAGRSACFNVEPRVECRGGVWNVAQKSVGTRYGALEAGGRREYLASRVGGVNEAERRSAFANLLVVSIECFDMMLQGYEFTHSFEVWPERADALDLGVGVDVPKRHNEG